MSGWYDWYIIGPISYVCSISQIGPIWLGLFPLGWLYPFVALLTFDLPCCDLTNDEDRGKTLRSNKPTNDPSTYYLAAFIDIATEPLS